MRLNQPIFRSESAWKELMERNEKLAIEVGRLRGDIRNLRKKNSSLLTWKLKVDQFHRNDLPILYDKSTQTESITVLLESSNPYKTPLRMKSVSQQNSSQIDSNYPHSCYAERDNNSSVGIQENISLPEEKSTHTSIATKAKNRRRSSSLFSLPLPIENNSHISPKQLAITKGLEEKIRHESTSENEQQQTLKLQQGDRQKNSNYDRFAPTLVTPDRPSRSVKKVVTYKEPSLRVKVRKGFQFFKFSDTPFHNDIEIEEQQSQPTSDRRENTYSLLDTFQEEEKEVENVIHVDTEEFAMYYCHHPTYHSP